MNVLIINSEKFRKSDELTLFLKGELSSDTLRKTELVICNRCEISPIICDFFEKKGKIASHVDGLSDNLATLEKIAEMSQFILLNILGFSDKKMEAIDSFLEPKINQQRQTYRVNRIARITHQNGNEYLEKLDLGRLSIHMRYQRIEVKNNALNITGLPIAGCSFNGSDWVIPCRLQDNSETFFRLADCDIQPFLDIVF